MPSYTKYKQKRGKLIAPSELIRWFDSVKNWRNDPEMRSFREQFTIISGNADSDWSLFRAKFRGDVAFLREEAKFVMDKLRIKRDNGMPLWNGFDIQIDIGVYGYFEPNIGKVLEQQVNQLKP
jgi:hypothetical protein